MDRLPVVHVEKASLPLNGGSIQEFLSRLREATRAHVSQKLNLGKRGHVWPVDVFGDHTVVEVSQFEETKKPFHKFFSIKFEKAKPGAAGISEGADGFTFGDLVEVVRRVTYVPKTEVQKRVDALEVQKNSPDLWKGVV